MWLYCQISLNTGMRSGEIQPIQKDTVSSCENYIYLAKTKNGDSAYIFMNEEAKAAVKALLDLNGNKFVHSTFFRTWNDMRGEFLRRGLIKYTADYKIFVFHVLYILERLTLHQTFVFR